MSCKLTGISSMATRQILTDLAQNYQQQHGCEVVFESVGGVDAARRVATGEAFDVAVLAANAIDKLIAAGHVLAGSKTDLARSAVAVAVRAGQLKPDISTEGALQEAVTRASTIGYSTGPSGVALMKLLQRWAIAETAKNKLIQAPAGVPVGELIARGDVALGFQQLSELINLPGIELLGSMPSECEIVTTFSGGVCASSREPAAATALLQYLQSPSASAIKQRNGMTPAA